MRSFAPACVSGHTYVLSCLYLLPLLHTELRKVRVKSGHSAAVVDYYVVSVGRGISARNNGTGTACVYVNISDADIYALVV